MATRRKTEETALRPAAFPQALTDPAAQLGNPLRGLKPARAASLLEAADRGDWTNIQWLMRYVERLDPDLLAIKTRRQSALGQLGWTIRISSERAARLGADKLAEEQKNALLEVYEAIDNLMDAVEFLETAVFRGFAHCALQGTSIEPLDQWWWLRHGAFGDWILNHDLKLSTGINAAADRTVPADGAGTPWIIAEEENPVLWIAILKYMRANQSQKWWDAFCEVFSRRGTVIIAPPNVGDQQYPTFRTDAENVARGGSGALPNGSTVNSTNAIQGAGMPYEAHMRFLREGLVLAGTGGLLSMITAGPTGLGSGVGDAHDAAFKTLSRRDAARISGLLNRTVSRRKLDELFAGRPQLAYFALDTEEQETAASVAEIALNFSQAGFQPDPEELSERSGYTLTLKPQAPAGPVPVPTPGVGIPSPLLNRGTGADPSQDLPTRLASQLGVPAEWLQPVADLLAEIEGKAADANVSDTDLLAFAESAAARLPELFGEMDTQALADVFEKAMGAATLEGARAGLRRQLALGPVAARAAKEGA